MTRSGDCRRCGAPLAMEYPKPEPVSLTNAATQLDIVNNLPVRIDRLRECLGISMKDLAARAGVSKSYLFKALKYEKFPPTIWIVERIAEGIGVSPATVLSAESPLEDPFVRDVAQHVKKMSAAFRAALLGKLGRIESPEKVA